MTTAPKLDPNENNVTDRATASSLEAPSPIIGVTRRQLILASGSALFTAGLAPAGRAYAQGRAPVSLAFWMFENPQQRPWVQKRMRIYTEQNPHVKLDFQAFPFTDLGKKLSVGFATGTAPDGFISGDWLMPLWLSRNLAAPMDVTRLGYSSLATYTDDHPAAFTKGAIVDGKVYGYPLWFYGFSNYLNTNHFKEVGLDPIKNAPRTYQELGEVAKRLAIKEGNKFTRQGFKFAMHAPTWTMIQFNPILDQCGGAYFDAAGKCIVNNAAGVRAMTLRTSIAKQYGGEDPADSIATQPLPGMDWLRERNSMFISHPIPHVAIASQNKKMLDEGYFRAAAAPSVDPGKVGTTTVYGFNMVVSARTTPDKQQILHDLYKFVLADTTDCWNDTAPFPLARKTGWADNPKVKSFPDIDEILAARDRGIPHPRTEIFNELADAMHKAVQRILLNNQPVKASLDEAAAEIDRAQVAAKRA